MTSQIPLLRLLLVGTLPWDFGGHDKNPVNNHTASRV